MVQCDSVWPVPVFQSHSTVPLMVGWCYSDNMRQTSGGELLLVYPSQFSWIGIGWDFAIWATWWYGNWSAYSASLRKLAPPWLTCHWISQTNLIAMHHCVAEVLQAEISRPKNCYFHVKNCQYDILNSLEICQSLPWLCWVSPWGGLHVHLRLYSLWPWICGLREDW